MGFALSVVVSESNSFLIIADFSVLVKQMESRIAFWEMDCVRVGRKASPERGDVTK